MPFLLLKPSTGACEVLVPVRYDNHHTGIKAPRQYVTLEFRPVGSVSITVGGEGGFVGAMVVVYHGQIEDNMS
jgi:hypothetical protein